VKHLRDEVSHFKIPHFFATMAYDQIPRTDAAKARKHLLREHVLARWSDVVEAHGAGEMTRRTADADG
jgi:hypothetical protein